MDRNPIVIGLILAIGAAAVATVTVLAQTDRNGSVGVMAPAGEEVQSAIDEGVGGSGALRSSRTSLCNRPPVLIVEPNAPTVEKEGHLAILVYAVDPDGDAITFDVDYSDICAEGAGVADEPEFFTEPIRPIANLFWQPAATRSGTYDVTFTATDDPTDPNATVEETVTITVTDKPAITLRIDNSTEIDPNRTDPNAIWISFLYPASYPYPRPLPACGWDPNAGIINMHEGATLVLTNILTYCSLTPYGAGAAYMGLLAEYTPSLGSAKDQPYIEKGVYSYDVPDPNDPNQTITQSHDGFFLRWMPNHTRGGAGYQDYTLRLVPYYRFSDWGTTQYRDVTVRVYDRPYVTYPQDSVYVDAGGAFDFQIEVSDYYGGDVAITDVNAPAGSLFDPNNYDFTWSPGTGDVSRLNLLKFKLVDPNNPNTVYQNATIRLGVTPTSGDDAGNLILNPDFTQADLDNGTRPAGWTPSNSQSDPINLTWETDPDDPNRMNLVAEREYEPNGFDWTTVQYSRWEQTVYLTPSVEESLTGDEVYELTVTYKLEDARINFNQQGYFATWLYQGIGVGLSMKGISWQPAHPAEIAELAPISHEQVFSPDPNDPNAAPDSSDCCYHLTQPPPALDKDWRTYHLYYSIPPGTRMAQVYTHNRSQGRIRVRHMSLRRVAANSGFYPFEIQDGNVPMLKNDDGAGVFVIDYGMVSPLDYTATGGGRLSYADMRDVGFNTAWLDGDPNELIDAGLYATHWLMYTPYDANDPLRLLDANEVPGWDARDAIRSDADDLAALEEGGLDILYVDGPDESNYYNLSLIGAAPKLAEMRCLIGNFKEQYAVTHTPVPAYVTNCLPRSWDPHFDEPWAALMDTVSFTTNAPPAYTIGLSPYSYGLRRGQNFNIGAQCRRWSDLLQTTHDGEAQPLRGELLGQHSWAGWRGVYDNQTWSAKRVPYHLLRFAAFNEVVNGASIITTFFCGGLSLNGAYDRYMWHQLVEINGEMAAIYDVLNTPRYYASWTHDCNEVVLEGMLKKMDGAWYLIVTNPSEQYLDDVTISLTGSLPRQGIATVTALFESARTNTEYAVDFVNKGFIDEADAMNICQRGHTRLDWLRSVSTTGKYAFSDDFVDHGVHVYKIVFAPALQTLDMDDDGLPDTWETTYFGNLSQGPDGDYDSDALINLDEYTLGCDPADTDTDDDGWQDGAEVHSYGTNPLSADTDSDTLDDPNDNCPLTINVLQADSDGDGFGDACDKCPEWPGDPNAFYATFDVIEGCPDCDQNGIRDDCEIDNDPNLDANNDGWLDTCTCDDDEDCDGYDDSSDNCPTTYSYDQADTDGDGFGDVCDGCPNWSDPNLMICPDPNDPNGVCIVDGCPDCGCDSTIEDYLCKGDCNCDGVFDMSDYDGFYDALINAVYCDGTGYNADMDRNGSVGFGDITPFSNALIACNGKTCPYDYDPNNPCP